MKRLTHRASKMALTCLIMAVVPASGQAQQQPNPAISFSYTGPTSFIGANDMPGSLFVDDKGRFFMEDSLSQYDLFNPANYNHAWRFFYGNNIDDLKNKPSDPRLLPADDLTVKNTIDLCENSPLSKLLSNEKGANGKYKCLFRKGVECRKPT